MEESGFFASIKGDRKYKSDLIATFFSKLFTNGVFNNELQVQANNDMTVTLKSGIAFINGYFYNNTIDKVINISLSDTEQSRIDSVVLRLSKENRQIIVDVLEGAYADNPVVPELTRNSNIYELRLCNILVNKQADSITPAMIEDCRFNSTDCGQVISAVQQLDTTEIFAQYQAVFEDLFEQMKGILSGDVVGELLVEINNIKNKMVSLGTCTDKELEQAIAESDLSNTVLKDKDDKIINPKIPRYEKKFFDLILESDLNEINITDLKLKPNVQLEIIIDGHINAPSGEYTNIILLPNEINNFSVSRTIGSENRNGQVTSILNNNTNSLYLGRSTINSNFFINCDISWQGSYIKNNALYSSSSIAGSLGGLIEFKSDLIKSLKLKSSIGNFTKGTRILILEK